MNNIHENSFGLRLHIILYFIISIFCRATLFAESGTTSQEQAGLAKAVPIDPMPATFTLVTSNRDLVPKTWSSMTPTEKINHLGIHQTIISVAKSDQSGSLSYLSAGGSAQNSDYVVTMDTCFYNPEKVNDNSGNLLGIGYVGVGLRVKAALHTVSAHIDLGSLFSIGAAAQHNKVQGTMTVEIIGVDSADVNNLFVTTSTIDGTSIEKTLESMATIFSKIKDSRTTLTPQILAVEPVLHNGLMATNLEEIKSRLQRLPQ